MTTSSAACSLPDGGPPGSTLLPRFEWKHNEWKHIFSLLSFLLFFSFPFLLFFFSSHFGGSETLKIVIPVENYPPKRSLRVNAALFIFLAVFLGVCLDDGRSFGGERCPKVVNCTQVCASMRRVGDRYPDSSGAGPSNKPPPPRGMLARPCRGFVKSLGVGPSLQRSSALH